MKLEILNNTKGDQSHTFKFLCLNVVSIYTELLLCGKENQLIIIG